MIAILSCGFIYACAAACGIIAAHLICARISRLEDGPAPTKLHPVIPVALFAFLGLILAGSRTDIRELGLVALVGIPLIAAWYSDALNGIVPDAFTLIPLAIIGVIVLIHRSWGIGASILVIFLAFAASAWLSKGRGMGWGDAKLAALCGAILGLPVGLLTLAVACFAATAYSIVRDRGTKPIAFAPFMVVCSLVAIFFTARG